MCIQSRRRAIQNDTASGIRAWLPALEGRALGALGMGVPCRAYKGRARLEPGWNPHPARTRLRLRAAIALTQQGGPLPLLPAVGRQATRASEPSAI